MQIVIDIPEEIWEKVKDGYVPLGISKYLMNGTPLPKCHGRLIDADEFIEKVKKDRTHSCYIQSWTADDVLDVLNRNYAPTIIEADKESEDKE